MRIALSVSVMERSRPTRTRTSTPWQARTMVECEYEQESSNRLPRRSASPEERPAKVTPEERLDRIERSLDRHIEFVGLSLTALSQQIGEVSQQVARTAAAQEQTEARLQTLIEHVDRIAGRVDKSEQQ